jgi:3-oxoacyl-[acyl-carrier-protein] synthase III
VPATLAQNTTVPYSRILGYGAARGDLVVPNDDIVGPIDSSDEWIRQRTGIVTRVRASKDLTVQDLAKTASEEAIAASGVAREDIDAVLVASITFPYPTPSMAGLLAENLGIGTAAAWDISAACAGFTYGVAQADAMIKAGLAKNVLVVGAEKLSDFISPTDRSISFILGDGAGAVVVGPSDTPGIGPTVWGSKGENWHTIRMTKSWLEYRDDPESGFPTMEQDGRTVFRWAVWDSVPVVREAIEKAGLTPDDIDVFAPHQANMRIIDELAKQLKLPEHVVIARDIADTGNTSAASIPLATHRLLAEGQAKSGDVCLQIGFGAGLAFAAQVVILP